MPILIAIGFGVISLIWQIASQVAQVLVRPLINRLNIIDGDVPIAPADAADMVERSIIDEGTGAGYAGAWGMRPDAFHLMVLNTGEPYGVVEALSLLRRGLIDEGRFAEVVHYSRIRNEFLPDLLYLQHDTMTAGDAITGALKGVIPPGEAADLFAKAGGLPDQFQTLLDTAGDPIGVQQALTLLNHGLISEAQAVQVIRHSRINPIFEGMALLTRRKFLTAFQIDTAVKSGAATIPQAISWLIAEGYTPEQVTAVVHGAVKAKTATTHNLTEAQVAEMWEVGAISKAEASSRLVALGYTATEVDFILAYYDEKRHLAMINGAVGQLRKVFLAGRIDKSAASAQLDSLGIDPQARTWLLDVWQVERATELRELTMAQIGGMFKKGLLADTEAVARWEAMGYSPGDAALLLADYGGPPPPGSPAAQAPGA